MDNVEFSAALERLGLWPKRAALYFAVTPKTVERWIAGSVPIPGAAARAIEAWLRFERLNLPWRPDEVVIGMVDEKKITQQISMMRNKVMDLNDVLEKVKRRGGPAASWSVDLDHHRAVLGGFLEVSFCVLEGGIFWPSGYWRADQQANYEQDLPLIEDAIACIANEIKTKDFGHQTGKKRRS